MAAVFCCQLLGCLLVSSRRVLLENHDFADEHRKSAKRFGMFSKVCLLTKNSIFARKA